MSSSGAVSVSDPNLQAAALAFDLKRLDPAFLDDPYPLYHALRACDPIHRMPDGSYFLTRYDDCVAVYRDAATWSSDKKVDFRPPFGESLLYEHHTTSLVFNDPPYHTRVRKLLAPAFTPRALAALRSRVETLVDRLLDRAAERGQIDLIDDFAAAIPVQLIGDMLGIPQDERDPLRAWSLAILGALEPVLTPAQFERGVKAVAEFKAYLEDLVRRRVKEGSRDESEILSKLIAASEVAGAKHGEEQMTLVELLHNCIFLLNAGHETTTNLIGNAVDLLIRHPDALHALRDDPALIESAVEEFLRMESSNQLGNRRATRDTELGGVAMPAGTYIHIGIGAANRDPAQFPDPDELDIRRRPNRHLAFATGIHACAGNSLARMEGQVAIGKLVQRFRTIARDGAFVRGGRARFRGFLHYPVRVA
ncbi:MAG TPA: cytochrome P450 [Alphaproteobacteria bacterium]|nr:cytochrome P450 [Alphaproteobacteria bacterium]